MKETAIINTVRGPVLDEKALVSALRTKKIAGAGLDVFEAEPKVEPELLKMDNCILLPYLASAPITARTEMGMIAADNLLARFENRELRTWSIKRSNGQTEQNNGAETTPRKIIEHVYILFGLFGRCTDIGGGSTFGRV